MRKVNVNYVLFDLTNKCNLSCKHCYKTNNVTDKELDPQLCLSIFDKLNASNGTNNVVLSGGEPSLYSRLSELIFGLKQRDAGIKFNTNGLIVPKEVVDTPYNKMRIQVSLDGYDSESYKDIRGVDLFETVCKNAVIMKEAGCNVSFRATITKKNISHYKDFITVSEQTGIPIVMRPMMNTGEMAQKELENSFEKLIDWKNKVISEGLIQYIGGEDFFTCTNCPLLCEEPYISVMSINVNGDVFPCSALRTEYLKLGSVYDSPIENIVEHFYVIRERIERSINCQMCKECGFRSSYGKGNCIVFCTFANRECVIKLMEGK